MTINPGNLRACLEQIQVRGKLGAEAALELLNRVADRAEELKRSTDPLVAADPFGAAAEEIAGAVRAAAREDRLDALRNATLRAKSLAAIDAAGGVKPAPSTAIGRALHLDGHMTAAEMSLLADMHGMNAAGRENVESLWKGVASLLTGQLDNDLRKLGLVKAAISGLMDRDLSVAVWRLNAGEAIGDSPAEQVAKKIQSVLDYMRTRLNAAGARIGDAIDYVVTTTHDRGKLRRAAGSGADIVAAFKAWWRFTEPRLAQKTFDLALRDGLGLNSMDPAAREAFGRQVYDALYTGVHMKFGGRDEGAYAPPAYEGTGNLARRLSQGRVLYWKDGAAWWEYNSRFGRNPKVIAAVRAAIDRGARHLALMEKFGTNPAANLNMIVRRVQELYRGDGDQLARFQGAIPKLKAVMAHLDGSANIVRNQRAAEWAQGMRDFETVVHLGGSGLTHFASIWPTVTSEMVHHGYAGAGGRLYTVGQLAKALVKGKGSAERQEVLADLGAYAHGLTRDMWSRWQAEDMLPGKVSSLANTFMKYTGLPYIFDNAQAAIREMSAHYLGRHAGDAFEALEPHVQRMIAKYGIGAREWDLLRSVPDLPVADGMRFMTPDVAMRIEGLGEPERWHLADRLAAYYNDAAAHGVVTPGVRERAAVLGTEAPGSFGGELRSFLFQFKMWPIAALHQVIGREIWMATGGRDVAWNLGAMLALSAAGGYLRMVVNDLASGQEPRNPLHPMVLLEALAQGGGLGIYGDFLFGEVARTMGNGADLLGPAAGDVGSLIDLFARFKGDLSAYKPHRRGRFSDIVPELARIAVRHMPFANYVYLKGALDYLLWYHLYEAASPGWWERANRRMAHGQGRVMAGYTPGAGVPWTPWGIGARTMTVPTRR